MLQSSFWSDEISNLRVGFEWSRKGILGGPIVSLTVKNSSFNALDKHKTVFQWIVAARLLCHLQQLILSVWVQNLVNEVLRLYSLWLWVLIFKVSSGKKLVFSFFLVFLEIRLLLIIWYFCSLWCNLVGSVWSEMSRKRKFRKGS